VTRKENSKLLYGENLYLRLSSTETPFRKQQCRKATRGVCKLNSFSGSQLWKLDGSMLQNKDKIWMSDEEWVLKTKTNLIYIENILTKKVLGTTNDSKVIPEDYEEGKAQQLWKKGEPDAEGYFTLENSNGTKIMTANYLNSSILQIKGNITLKWIQYVRHHNPLLITKHS
jgi:hypothetical protein